MKFSVKNFFSKYEQILSFLRLYSYLLKKSLKENLIFCSATLVLLFAGCTFYCFYIVSYLEVVFC